MLAVTFNRLALTADNDIQAIFMAIPFLLKVHCLCWACQHRMWGSTLTRVLVGSTEMRAVNSTGSQHCPWRLQILEHLSFGVSNCSLHIVLSLQFMYLKEVVTVKLLLRWKALRHSKCFYYVSVCTECISRGIYAVYFVLLIVRYWWDSFKSMKARYFPVILLCHDFSALTVSLQIS